MRLRLLWPDLRSQKRLLLFAIALIPVISLLQIGGPLVIRHIVDNGILKENLTIILNGAGVFLAIVLAEYASRASQAYLTAQTVHRMVLSLRQRLIEHILRLGLKFHDRNLSGALVTRATSDFDNLSESLNQGVLTSIVDLAVLFGCIVGMFLLSWQLALVALALLPFIVVIVTWFSRALKRALLNARRKIAALNAFAQEAFYGVATIKVLNAERAASERFAAKNLEYRNAQMSSVLLDATMFSILDGVASITVGLTLYLAVSSFADMSQLSAGLIVAFVQLIQQMFEPLKNLGNKIAMLQGAFTAIDRVFSVLETREFVEGQDRVPPLQGEISFENVSFSYAAAGREQRHTINGVTFSALTGTSTALVGATGSGKSTIIKLLTKLYDGYSGSIKIDGVDIRKLDGEQLREEVAIVPQEIVLFDGTIAFNITLGRDMPRAAIIDAAKLVGAHEFIERLPRSYDEDVREQGASLSHGQKQLIAFVRAIVRDPKILVLDEATSSVDQASEALIQSATERLLQGRTVVVIAHRLSTIEQCDNIIVLDQGELVEQGSHANLLASRGAYHRLYHAHQTV